MAAENCQVALVKFVQENEIVNEKIVRVAQARHGAFLTFLVAVAQKRCCMPAKFHVACSLTKSFIYDIILS